MKKTVMLLATTGILFFHSCKKDSETNETYLGRNYFPVKVGHELVYDVDFITKSSFTGRWDSLHYQLKEIITQTYLDNEGRETQRIERYIKNDTSGTWTISRVWASNLLFNYGQREEDNIRYNKLYFPLSSEVRWNGNIENTMDERKYHYTGIHKPVTLGNLTFDSTLSVLQFQDTTLINSNYYFEQYAANVGLIYKENKDINYNFCGNPACDSIIDAYIYRETLVSYAQ